MSENKRDGLERVRQFLLTAAAGTGFVKATTEEIGTATGMSKQMASRHVKTLIEFGMLQKLRQSVYALEFAGPIRPAEVDAGLTSGLQTVDVELTNFDCEPSEVDVELTQGLQTVDTGLTNCTKRKILKKKEKNKNEEMDFENFSFGKEFYPGLSLGNGILLEGAPTETGNDDNPAAELDRRIDWNHPIVRSIQRNIESIFNTKEPRWSPNLTKYLVAGVVYGMSGFQRIPLLSQAQYVQKCLSDYRTADKMIREEKFFTFKDNKFPKYGWFVVFAYVRERFEEHGIRAHPCEKPNKEKRKDLAANAKKTPLFDLIPENDQDERKVTEYGLSPEEAARRKADFAKDLRKHGESRASPKNEQRDSNSSPKRIGDIFTGR